MMEKKSCYGCDKELPLDKFYVDRSREDGRQGRCIECAKKYVVERKGKPRDWERKTADRAAYDRARYAANPEYFREKAKRKIARRKLKAGPFIGPPQRKGFIPRLSAEDRRWRRCVKERVRRAVISGQLVRGPCEVCGELETEAHHADYDQPLLVVWLCKGHHSDVHHE